MKKLSKLSLLGEMDLLSKAELKQLVGASGDVHDGCEEKGSCMVGRSCVTDDENAQSGACGVNLGTNNCECFVNARPTKPSSGYFY